MPPRRKSRRLNEPQPQAQPAQAIQFVPDPVPNPSAPSGGQNNDVLVAAIVQAVKAAVAPQVSNNEPSTSSAGGDVVQGVVADEVGAISGVEVGTGSQSPLFHSIAVPLGSRVSAKLKSKIWADEFVDMGAMLNTSTTQEKYSLSITAPNPGVSTI